tara:strand:+ start:301 stop:477 length:177 start_codon:yes stop_codon:yes gene_type:complete
MPKVGDREFAYTPEGIAEAESYAQATGQTVEHNAMNRSKYFYGGAVDKMYKKGGKVKK